MLDRLSDQDIIYVVYCGIAVGALVFVSGLGQLFSPQENRDEARSRRMRMIADGRSTAELLALLKPTPKTGLLARIPFVGDLTVKLRKAGWMISARMFVAACLMLWGAITLVGANFAPIGTVALLAIVPAFVLPLAVLNARINQRTEKLVLQLPDALELMARGLKVGHPLAASIAAVAEEMPDPIGTEFGLIHDQVNYGEDLVDAFKEFAERVDVEDVNYLSASIGIQYGTGGDLVRVISVLSRTIRNRIAMRRKIRAISSEGRLSAWFLSALPLVIFGFTMSATPEYYGGVMADPMFRPMAITVIVLVIANALVLRKLVNFKL
ncbi:type II secretion system F family protein [Tropicimonas sediminicola]|uniref:Tight adherence protein B n=1 Tax=Tropicimonas sediminicola TaxID=1031541 RepID=A0A239ELW0_9RHOB|nr:type II secretion system F family protein [Tropicimonas sediminicola]SNS45023.1 tight adherence protein B [Tropicimonas sediminicola]